MSDEFLAGRLPSSDADGEEYDLAGDSLAQGLALAAGLARASGG